MKWLCLVAALFLFAGCGDVNWFPDSTTTTSGGTTGNATGPDQFEFPANTATISDANSAVLSQAAMISGDNANGWKISLTGIPADIIINGAFIPRDVDPNPVIKPGQNLVISQDIPAIVRSGEKLTTTVNIGTTKSDFVTTIQ